MLTILMATLLAAASDPVPVEAASLDKQPTRYCRPLMIGISRSSDVYICRSKKAWTKVDSCAGATRYCPPAEKASIGVPPQTRSPKRSPRSRSTRARPSNVPLKRSSERLVKWTSSLADAGSTPISPGADSMSMPSTTSWDDCAAIQ